MAIVTGTLTDFGASPLAAFQPLIRFRPSGPAVRAGKILATRTISVTPAANGSFSVDLEPTDSLNPDRWYVVTIVWMDAASNYQSRDFVDWKIRVPTAGGAIDQLVQVPSNPAQVWYGLTPPPNPTPGTWWLVMDPNDPMAQPLPPYTRGDLYEWS